MGHLSQQALAALEARLGIEFRDRSLLEQALTHKSYRPEDSDQPVPANERLEFLGDAVLDAVIAAHLYVTRPDWSEGELTKVKAVAVSEATLSRIGGALGLGEFLLLGKGEEQSGGRERPSLLADAVEAIIGAVFLDQGGGDHARFPMPAFVLRILGPDLEAIEHAGQGADYKTLFQELSQGVHRLLPTYRVVDESGPDHAKTFVVEARLGDEIVGVGKGRSKKEAEQSAAREALESMRHRAPSNDDAGAPPHASK